MGNWFKIIAIPAFVLLLSGCEQTKEQLGLARNVPDEFAVMKRAPLEMPPDYSLRPPRPGVARPQEAAPETRAQTAVFGAERQAAETPEDGEAALLQGAGADAARPGIRDQVDREAATMKDDNRPVADKLLDWGRSEPPAKVVDAEAEAARLRKNVEEGKPVTEGETPSVDD